MLKYATISPIPGIHMCVEMEEFKNYLDSLNDGDYQYYTDVSYIDNDLGASIFVDYNYVDNNGFLQIFGSVTYYYKHNDIEEYYKYKENGKYPEL